MSNETSTGSSGAVGVQDLIDRLKTDGVSRGKIEAEALLADARKQSMAIRDEARQEAESILASARSEAHQIEENGKQALRLAARDATLKLKESFQHEYKRRFAGLVSQTLSDTDFLKKLILEIARRSVPHDTDEPIEVLLPSDTHDHHDGADGGSEALSHFVAGLTGDMLREGVTFGTSDSTSAGVRVRLQQQDVEIDLTEETVSTLLMRFLAPRFRALVDAGK
jgi:V/A-type H+-transporting ATPase subunit E